jgi:hypothetical protein
MQLGDFGYWPTSQRFLDAVAATGVPVWFLDGNHEHFPHLWDGLDEARALAEPVEVAENLTYLPRGARLEFEDVKFAVLGGAHSIDRRLRTSRVDWFSEEAVTDFDLDLVLDGPVADIMLSHDAPVSAPVPLMDDEFLASAWLAERPACHAHRLRIETAFRHLQPALVAHGHYHVRYDRTTEQPWGTTRFLGLSHNGTGAGAFALLTCEDGEWRITP